MPASPSLLTGKVNPPRPQSPSITPPPPPASWEACYVAICHEAEWGNHSYHTKKHSPLHIHNKSQAWWFCPDSGFWGVWNPRPQHPESGMGLSGLGWFRRFLLPFWSFPLSEPQTQKITRKYLFRLPIDSKWPILLRWFSLALATRAERPVLNAVLIHEVATIWKVILLKVCSEFKLYFSNSKSIDIWKALYFSPECRFYTDISRIFLCLEIVVSTNISLSGNCGQPSWLPSGLGYWFCRPGKLISMILIITLYFIDGKIYQFVWINQIVCVLC